MATPGNTQPPEYVTQHVHSVLGGEEGTRRKRGKVKGGTEGPVCV